MIAFIVYNVTKKKRKEISEFSYDYEDDGRSLNKYFKTNDLDDVIFRSLRKIANDSMLKIFNFFLKKMNPFKIKHLDGYYLSENEIKEARDYRIREIRIWKAIKEIAVYLVFISVLFFVVYSNNGQSAFGYQMTMRNNFDLSTVCLTFF